MNAERLQDLVRGFSRCRVAVLGDFFLDKYLDVDPALVEVSLETGKPAHQVVSTRCSPGAAGTVVNNLAALGAASIRVLGFTGDDGDGFELRRALEAKGADTSGLLTVAGRFTPTYLKPRDCRNPGLAGEHERYDTKNREAVPARVQERVIARLVHVLPDLDAVIVLDQVDEADCGIVTAEVRAEVVRLAVAHPRTLFWADSRRRIGLFRHVIVKANAGEAVREVLGDAAGAAEDAVVARAAVGLRARTGKPAFVTAGRRGIWVADGAATRVRAVRIEEPTDPTGAGDSATAGAILALGAGASILEAALVANLVASITVQQLATTGTAAPSELGPRLELWRGQAEGEEHAVRD